MQPKILEKVKFFTWKILHGRVNTQSIQMNFSFGCGSNGVSFEGVIRWILVTYCEVISLRTSYGLCFRTFGVAFMCNGNYRSTVKEIMMNSPFDDMEECCHRLVPSLLCQLCGTYGSRGIIYLETSRGLWRRYGTW